jgi:CheY-like chemotaxis protein
MLRVLLADDSPVARLAVARRMRAAGLDVVEHDSVASASVVDPSVLACALLDLELGDGYGTDVAESLRAQVRDLPVAFFTSATDGEARARAEGMGPVFAKPDELDAAVAWVQRQV